MEVILSTTLPFLGGWQILDLDRGSLHSTAAGLMSILIARTNNITGIVQPVMMPLSRRCHADVVVVHAETVVVVLYEFFDLLWNMVCCQSFCHQFVRNGSLGVSQVKLND